MKLFFFFFLLGVLGKARQRKQARRWELSWRLEVEDWLAKHQGRDLQKRCTRKIRCEKDLSCRVQKNYPAVDPKCTQQSR
ncbi:hypothetical protein V8C42DRAFT_2100 [Trichoderma barbatum]